jgi:dienelactone hydrolase
MVRSGSRQPRPDSYRGRPAATQVALRTADLRLLLLAGFFAMTAIARPASADRAEANPTGLQSHVTFDVYTPLSRSSEMLRRLASPFDALRVMQAAGRAGKPLREQAIELADEHFAAYVPSHPPPQGYALLVFVSPWDEGAVPIDWTTPLDRHGMILVTAAKSGNSASVLGRREPLALLAAQNIMSRYPIDAGRVYVGGFSGGSRVAERLAVGYPDVFHGALLIAGSDPIGDAHLPLPPAPLLALLQESTRLVFAAGEHDEYHRAQDAHSRPSLAEWCVFDSAAETIPFMSHELPDASGLDRLLDALVQREPPDPHRLADCRARIDRSLEAELKSAEEAIASGRIGTAKRSLDKIDARYGGLAAPRSIELASSWLYVP